MPARLPRSAGAGGEKVNPTFSGCRSYGAWSPPAGSGCRRYGSVDGPRVENNRRNRGTSSIDVDEEIPVLRSGLGPFWIITKRRHAFQSVEEELGDAINWFIHESGEIAKSCRGDFIALGTGLAIGGTLGLASGYLGGLVDGAIMRVMDVMLAFPGELLAMAIIAARGRGLDNLVLAIGIAEIPDYARIARGQVLGLRNLPFVEEPVASGASSFWIMTRHILPDPARPVLVFATIGAGFALLASWSLSFTGLDAQPPTPQWGAMLSDGRSFLSEAWWIGAFPGLAIVLTFVSVNVVSQWLRERTGQIRAHS